MQGLGRGADPRESLPAAHAGRRQHPSRCLGVSHPQIPQRRGLPGEQVWVSWLALINWLERSVNTDFQQGSMKSLGLVGKPCRQGQLAPGLGEGWSLRIVALLKLTACRICHHAVGRFESRWAAVLLVFFPRFGVCAPAAPTNRHRSQSNPKSHCDPDSLVRVRGGGPPPVAPGQDPDFCTCLCRAWSMCHTALQCQCRRNAPIPSSCGSGRSATEACFFYQCLTGAIQAIQSGFRTCRLHGLAVWLLSNWAASLVCH